MNIQTNRLKGHLSKIGIHPTIDGRWCGVRESFEDQTMNMAKKGDMGFQWHRASRCSLPGSRIGQGAVNTFPAVKSQYFRLRIPTAPKAPYICEMKLYQDQ